MHDQVQPENIKSKACLEFYLFLDNNSKAGHDLILHVCFSLWLVHYMVELLQDSVYVFQIQILEVTLSDAHQRALVSPSSSHSVLHVYMWVCKCVCIFRWLYERMCVHVHTHMWNSQVKLEYCFLESDMLVFWDRVFHWDTRLIN